MTYNKEIKRMLRINSISQWKLGEALGLSEASIYRMLRTDISEEKHIMLKNTIEKMVSEEVLDEA